MFRTTGYAYFGLLMCLKSHTTRELVFKCVSKSKTRVSWYTKVFRLLIWVVLPNSLKRVEVSQNRYPVFK